MVALDALLRHRARDRILAKCEVAFVFIEEDDENTKLLKNLLSTRDPLPTGVTCQVLTANCFPVLAELVEHFKKPNHRLAPAFFFVDPYTFKIPGSILRDLMSFERVELFVNVIWRELDMSMRQPEKMKKTLDSIFAGRDWQGQIAEADHVARAHQTARLIQQMTGARWGTYIRMLGSNGATKYLLLHLTNHDAGRDLMKECMWSVSPDGGFYASKSDDPGQEYLITSNSYSQPVRNWIIDRLAHGACRWAALAGEFRATLWRDMHLNDAVRQLRREGVIEATEFTGRFSRNANPVLKLRA